MPKKKNNLNVGDNQRFGAVPNNKPFQGAEMPQGRPNNDVGREDARQIRESRQQFPREIERPDASSTSRQQLREAQQRQQQLQRQAQQQVGGQQPQPQGSSLAREQIDARRSKVDVRRDYEAPTSSTANKGLLQQQLERQQRLQRDAQSQVRQQRQQPTTSPRPVGAPKNGQVIYSKNGGIHIGQTQPRSGLGAAVVGTALQAFGESEMGQRFGDWVWDNTLGWVLAKSMGVEQVPIARARANNEFAQNYEQNLAAQDRAYDDAYELSLVEERKPIQPGEAPPAPDLGAPEFPDEAPSSNSPFRAKQGSHNFGGQQQAQQRQQPAAPRRQRRRIQKRLPPKPPTKEQVINQNYDNLRISNPDDAVAYGKQKHKELFPHLYK
jgi:hypothetical protein